jgi:GNAT superfamily N-acetyltransferase
MEIRELTPEEMEQAGEVTAAAYLEYEGEYGAEPWWDRYITELAAVRDRAAVTTVLAAIEDGEVLGTITVELDKAADGTARTPSEAGNLRMLAVAPGARRRGVARALMVEALDVVRRSGRPEATLPTTKYMSAGHSLYEELGFVRDPSIDMLEDDGTVVVMGFRVVL